MSIVLILWLLLDPMRSDLVAPPGATASIGVLVLVGAGVLVAGAIAGLSGFGFNLVSVPLLILILEPRTGIVVSLLAGMAVTAAMLLSSSVRAQIDGSTLWLLIRASVVGVPIGLLLFARANEGLLSGLVGAVTVLYAIGVLGARRNTRAPSRMVGVAAGVASGALAASTGLSGPPAVLLAHYRGLSSKPFRATLSAYFFVISGVSVALIYALGLAPTGSAGMAAPLAPVALAGMAVGRSLFPRVPEALFQRVVVLGLLVMGALNVVRLIV